MTTQKFFKQMFTEHQVWRRHCVNSIQAQYLTNFVLLLFSKTKILKSSKILILSS